MSWRGEEFRHRLVTGRRNLDAAAAQPIRAFASLEFYAKEVERVHGDNFDVALDQSASSDSICAATPDRRPRRKSMARRSGQIGYEEAKGGWYHVRFRMDVPGQEKRAYLSKPICPFSGPGALTKPERLKRRKEIIAASGADTVEHFSKVEAINHGTTFRKQAEWWLNHVQTRKRNPITPATAAGFGSYLKKWLNPSFGDLPLSSINNLAVKGLVIKMTDAGLSPKMVNNVFQVVKMVVASAVNENGERIHPRTWSHEFIDLPEVKNQRQPTHTSEAMKAIVASSQGRERMLYTLLGATGLRLGEALGIEIDKQLFRRLRYLAHPTEGVEWTRSIVSENRQRGSRHRPAFFHRRGDQEVCRKPGFGFSLLLEERQTSPAVEHLEAFATHNPRGIETAKIGCSRIPAVPHDVAEETASTRGSHSLLARSRQQERYGRLQQAEGGRGLSQKGRGASGCWLRASY